MSGKVPTQWIWSQSVNQYYYISQDEIGQSIYVFQDGRQIPVQDNRSQAPIPPSQPRSFGEQSGNTNLQTQEYGRPQYDNYQAGSSNTGDLTSHFQEFGLEGEGDGEDDDDLNQDEPEDDGGRDGAADEGLTLPSIPEYRDVNGVASRVYDGPRGRVFLGSSGNYERLDKAFRKRSRSFFKVGKVFLTLWSEPMETSNTTNLADSGVSRIRFNEHAYSGIRRFVVTREGSEYCNAIAIKTHGGRGIAGRNVQNSEYAIIYSGDRAPTALVGESGMRSAIRVVPSDRNGRLDPMSRVNLGKVYTVEHKLKVKPVGMVKDIQRFLNAVEQVRAGDTNVQVMRQDGPSLNAYIPTAGRSRVNAGDSRTSAQEAGRSKATDLVTAEIQRVHLALENYSAQARQGTISQAQWQANATPLRNRLMALMQAQQAQQDEEDEEDEEDND